MKTKKIDISVLNQVTGISQASKGIQEIEKGDFILVDKNINFSYKLSYEALDFFKSFVYFKRFKDGEFEYTQSKAFKEGVNLLKEKNPTLPKRPKNVKISTKRGQRVGGHSTGDNKIYTSFVITLLEKEFIYDYIYEKSKHNENYTKGEFLAELVETLKEKYKSKLK